MSSELKVGSLVIASVIIFVVTFVNVANVQLQGEKVTYYCYFTYAGGLDPGTAVRFGGLKAGVVANVKPWERDPTKVQVQIDLSDAIPVNEDCVATIAALSALGQNYLEITTGSASARRIEAGGTIPSVEAITINDLTAKLAELADISTTLMTDLRRDVNRITDQSETLLANLNELTGEKNRQAMEQLLESTNKMVSDQSPKIDRITDQVTDMLVKVDEVLGDLKSIAEKAHTTVANVNRTVEETREPLKRDLAEMEATLVEARKLLEDIQAIVAVNEVDVRETIENLRISSDNMEQLTNELRQRPWSLLRVQPKPDRRVPLPAAK